MYCPLKNEKFEIDLLILKSHKSYELIDLLILK